MKQLAWKNTKKHKKHKKQKRASVELSQQNCRI